MLGLVSAFGHGGLRGPITKQAVVESIADHESVDTVADVLRRLPVLGDAGLLFPRHSQAKGADIANAVGSWSCFDGHESCSNRPIVAINYGHNFAGEYILHVGLRNFVCDALRPTYMLFSGGSKDSRK